jgi:tetratricopeptide (TPR) repeat protein
MNRFNTVFMGLAILSLILLAAVLSNKFPKAPWKERLVPKQESKRTASITEARSAFDQGDFAEAFRLSEQVLENDPDSKDALLIAGKAAHSAGEHDIALKYFRAVDDDGSEKSLDALMQSGHLSVKLGRLTDAEAFYQSVLRHRPGSLAANRALLNLLRIEGRNWEALPAIHQVLRQRQYTFENLALAGPLEAVWLRPDTDVLFLKHCARAEPGDLLCVLGTSRSLIFEDGDLGRALQGLLRVVAWNPDLIEAQAALGQLLFNNGADQEFLAWHSRLPKSADKHPAIWVTRGRWARGQQQTRAAIRCLCEANRVYTNDRAANLLMASLLVENGDTELAAQFQQRGEDLQAFDSLLTAGELPPAERAARMIEILERLGRLWEANGWSHLLLSMEPNSSIAKAAVARLDQRLTPETPLTLESANLASTIDCSEFPLPDLPSTADLPFPENSKSAVSFDDVSEDVKLGFTYFVDKPRMENHVYTFDFAGGGAAVLDYDQDGWPDLYLTQSCSWPPSDANAVRQNRLFRNNQGQSFEDCTLLAGVGDSGFGTGVAVGDVDGDGFPDLYVNNLGRNRFYHNNGDGTFTDRTDQSGTAGDDYSLSAVFVDLNRDGLPELYVVNYLGGDAMTRQCRNNGKPVQCSPRQFPGQQDRLYLNLGNGRFREVTEESGILDSQGIGKGMDVIAADLDGIGGPDLFIANDTTANFLFVNASDPGSQSVRLKERGTRSGVAYDDLGRMQSSMGIAARDANQDGLIDLLVTNFFKERNNLYVQTARQPDLLFSDHSLPSNLSPSSLTMGWGTQFLDAELDGDWDLVVANGYLGQIVFGSENGMMRPQFFENQGAARFRELSARDLGQYFASDYFGRAVARLDWNRDGLEDLCITHMEAPVSLLQNTSQRRGRFVAIQLRGVLSSRDAIGSIVRIKVGSRQWTEQLTAGGGFQAASQQQIVVGLGDCELIEQLTVRWPDESEQDFRNVPADRELMLIQGHPAPILLR